VNDHPNGLMLSATESAMCSFEMMPMISDGRPRPLPLTTTAMTAPRRPMRWAGEQKRSGLYSWRIEPKSQAAALASFSPTLIVVSLTKRYGGTGKL